MISRWWKTRKRQAIVSQTTQTQWYQWLPHTVPWFSAWPTETREKFIANIKIFIAEKNWEGCSGLELTTEMQVFIAAQASMMLLGVEDYCFDDFETILVFPSQFQRRSGDGLMVWHEWRIGEAWPYGPIVLAWNEFREGLQVGQNVMIHELAHHIDELHGDISSVSRFGDQQTIQQWKQISRIELERLKRLSEAGRATLLDPYGKTNDAEFFAVASESFFQQPHELSTQHDSLYQCLTKIYHCDPEKW